MLYTVPNLESSAFLFHLLPNIPLQHLFHSSSISTHQPFSPTSLVIPPGNPNNHLSSFLPALKLYFHSCPLYHSIFLHRSSITFTHVTTGILPLVIVPLFSVHRPSSFLSKFCSSLGLKIRYTQIQMAQK